MLTISISVIAWFLFVLSIVFFFIIILQRDVIAKKEDQYIQLAGKEDFFQRKDSLIREDEFEFYKVLKNIIGDNYYLFPQVHLSEIVDIKNNFKDHNNLYEILGNKSVDYAIFSKDKMTPLIAIELNGKSHLFSVRINRDALVQNILQKANMGLIYIDKDNYNIESVTKEIKDKLPNPEMSI